MGQLIQFRCKSCAYEAQVDGRISGGMQGISQATIHCETCKVIGDISLSDEQIALAKESKSFNVNCPVSDKHVARLWKHPGPCPVCGQTMDAAGIVLMWD